MQGKLSEKLRLWGEFQPRYSFETGNFSTVLLRPGLGWQLTEELTVWAGYAWTPLIYPTSRDEHRIWTQLIYAAKLGALALTQRLRMETRFIENVSDTVHRLRYQARFALPLGYEGNLQAVIYDELFLLLNSASASIQPGFDQNRLFLGGFLRLSPWFAFDAGYMWNAIKTPQLADNRTNHVVMFSLYFSFDASKRDG